MLKVNRLANALQHFVEDQDIHDFNLDQVLTAGLKSLYEQYGQQKVLNHSVIHV